MHPEKLPESPILQRLATTEAMQEEHKLRIGALEDRIQALEVGLSQLLGADLQWTPPPQAVEARAMTAPIRIR